MWVGKVSRSLLPAGQLAALTGACLPDQIAVDPESVGLVISRVDRPAAPTHNALVREGWDGNRLRQLLVVFAPRTMHRAGRARLRHLRVAPATPNSSALVAFVIQWLGCRGRVHNDIAECPPLVTLRLINSGLKLQRHRL